MGVDVENRSVDGAPLGAHAARIPDTPERQRLAQQRSIREVVFGAQDGVLTTLGIVTGIGGATTDRPTILLTGFLALMVGAISMGVGEFLGGKAEREVVQNAIEHEHREMVEMPEAEYAEQLAYYKLKGFTDEEAQTIVARLAKNPGIWLHEMVRDEFGIDLREAEGGGLRAAFAMAGSFALGGALPVIPYMLPIALGRAAARTRACGRRAIRDRGARRAAERAQSARQGVRDRCVRRGRLRDLVRRRPLHSVALRSRRDQRRRLKETGAIEIAPAG